MVPLSTLLAVRARRALARPAVRRLALGALALVTVLVTSAVVGRAQDARDRWGAGRDVLVARHDLEPGESVAAGDVERRALPRATVPHGVLTALPVGAVARHPILAGEPVVAERLAPAGLVGTAALVGRGHLAVAVPRGQYAVPPVVVGDLVDVLAVTPPAVEPGRDPPAFAVVEGATVVDVGDEAVTVSVPADDAPRLAWAVAQGAAVLALAGG